MIFFEATPYAYESQTKSELKFGTLAECNLRKYIPLGKILLLADSAVYLKKKITFAGYKVFTLLDTTDLNAPFAFDSLVGIVAYGSSQIPCARYVSSVLGIPCIVIPDLIDGEKILSQTVTVGETTYPATAPNMIFVDPSLLHGEAEAYARICSYSLSLFDAFFLSAFKGRKVSDAVKKVVTHCIDLPKWYHEDVTETIFTCDLALASLAETGFSRGMVKTLSTQIGSDLIATELILSVYSLFFREGYLRPFACPDYESRAKKIGSIPFLPDYETERLAETFTHLKGACLLEVQNLLERLPQMKRTYALLGGKAVKVEKSVLLDRLRSLPDYGGFSPLTLMREFGLLEEKPKRKRFR